MLMRDLRYGVRMLAANPAFTLIAGVTLALGIGATTAIFSVVDTVLLRRAPFPGLEQLAVVWETDRHSGTVREPASLPDFLDYQQRSREAARLAAFTGTEPNYTPEAGEPVRLQGIAVTHGFLPLLGLDPIAGRTFTVEEARRGGPRVALLSERLWRERFSRDPSVVGRVIRLDDLPYAVIGVMPAEAEFGLFQILRAADYSRSFADRGARASVDLWLPLQEDAQTMPRTTHPIMMLARLRAGVAPAQAELGAVAADLERTYPENAGRGVHVEPLAAIVFGPVQAPLGVLLAAVALVLLAACANVASLLLARATARRQEVAVRMALGAGAPALARQFLAEGLLLTLAAAIPGVALAAAGVKILVALAPAEIPRIANASVDLRVLAAALAVSVLAGIGFGLVPLLQARRADVQEALRAEGGRTAAGARGRLRSALVVAEFALAVILLAGATLLGRSFREVMQVDPGFRVEGVVKAEYQLPPSRYPLDFQRWPDLTEIHRFNVGLLQRAAVIPGVQAAAIASNHPLDPGFTNSFVVVGREAEAQDWPEISTRGVTPDYFRVMGVPLVRGRFLAESDGTKDAPVVVINEAAAERFFQGRDPIGQQVVFWGTPRRIVGVVGDERFHGLTEATPPAVYAPLAQTPSPAGVVLVRSSANPRAVAASIRAAIREQDPALAIFGLEPLSETIGRSVGERRFTMLVLGVLASAALLLAAAGIYGVLSYIVSQRTREIGIRMALGARHAGVRWLVVKEGMMLALAGAGIGMAGAWVVTRFLRSLLFGISATDPATFAVVPIVLLLIALGASYVPARRATRVDPVVALRQ